MTDEQKIRNLIKKIAGTFNDDDLFITAQIVSVDTAETCTVIRNGLVLQDVKLSTCVDGNPNKMLIRPAIQSTVLIADLSYGDKNDLAIIGWSEIDSISLNGGTLGGMINIASLTDALNNFVTKAQQHKHSIPVGSVVIAAQNEVTNPKPIELPTTDFDGFSFDRTNYEDTKINH